MLQGVSFKTLHIRNTTLIYDRTAQIFASFRKSGSRNTMVTSDFFTGSGNMAVSRMRDASGHNYRNSSFIIDVAMGQIPRSTERISS